MVIRPRLQNLAICLDFPGPHPASGGSLRPLEVNHLSGRDAIEASSLCVAVANNSKIFQAWVEQHLVRALRRAMT
jgi:hypothetical protein